MATTVDKAFREFEARIALTDAQRQKVDTRVSSVKKLLQSSFPADCIAPLLSCALMGSASRGTIIRPLNDIDVFAVFQNKDGVFENYRGDSKAFLYWVRQRIDARTEVSKVGARGQVVRLFYKDDLHVDIAPVFSWSTGGYALPSGDGSWLTTDPPKQKEWASGREVALSRQFRRRVRLLKRWNGVHGGRLSSWHLEVIVGTVFTSMSANHRAGLRKFFEWAPGRLHVDDPDGHGGDLASGLTIGQIADIKDSLSAGCRRATAAVDAEEQGDHKEAIRLWRIILGDEFPAFG